MNVQYINPFLESCDLVFSKFGIEAKPLRPQLIKSPQLIGKISVLIGVTGKLRGQVLFNMEDKVAYKIASLLMGGTEILSFNEVSKSAIGELFNMVVGNAATIFSNKGIKMDITPPSLILGESIILADSTAWIISIPIELSFGGVMSIEISISES